METQNLNLTTPKLLEYAAKALMLVELENDWLRYGESHVNVTAKGTITVVFKGYRRGYESASVRIGDFPKYQAFTEKLLTKLNKVTGKNYTEKDLNIY
jgi:hypothetical protein